MSRDRNMNVIKASSLNHLNANNASPSSLLTANSNLQMMSGSSNNQKYANSSSNNKSVKNDDTSQVNKNERGVGGGGVENNKNNKSNKSRVSNNNNDDNADNELASFKLSQITSFLIHFPQLTHIWTNSQSLKVLYGRYKSGRNFKALKAVYIKGKSLQTRVEEILTNTTFFRPYSNILGPE